MWTAFQMDATEADIYLVSRLDKSEVIGRPSIYLAVDTATQLIAGIYVGLEAGEQAVDYRYHKLELAGGSRGILEGGALSAVHGYSEGNARKIDNLMTDALTIGAQQDQHCSVLNGRCRHVRCSVDRLSR